MIYVITGCYGFIGKKMCEYLLKQGQTIFGIDLIDQHLFSKYINFQYVSFDDVFSLPFPINKVDILYHFAWCGVSSSDKNDYKKQFTNIELTYKILLVFKDITKKIVIPGSISEFSKCNCPITGLEEDSPADLYAATKVAIRKICFQFCEKNNIVLNWLLITSVYGAERKDSNLLTYTIRKLLNNEFVECTKLEQLWDYIYIDDLIEAIICVGQNGKNSGCFPIGSGIVHPLSYYVLYIAHALNKEHLLKIGAIPYKNSYIDNSIVDVTKLNSFGFKCKVSYEKGIKNVIKFQENN